MIAAHPRVAVLPETSFVRRYIVTRKLEDCYRDGGLEQCIEVLEKDTILERLGEDLPTLLGEAAKVSHLPLDAALFTLLLRKVASDDGATLVVDKDPRLIERMTLLKRIWPQCRILHVFRDPRDVLASKKKAAWSKGKPAIRHVLAGRIQWQISERQSKRLTDTDYRQIRYESLLCEPGAELRNVCDWLQLQYDESMLEFASVSRQLVSEEEMAWKKETRGPLLTGNFGKWKNELSNFEAGLAEMTETGPMARGEYAKGEFSQPARFAARVVSCLLKILAALYIIATRRRPATANS